MIQDGTALKAIRARAGNPGRKFSFPWRAGVMALALVSSLPSLAAVNSGGTQSPFELGGSARTLGMGDAGVALTEEGDGFFSNPAVLATLNQNQILTFHAPLFLDTLYDSVGYVNPVATHASFGLGFARAGTSDILRTLTNTQALSLFSSEQLQAMVGYGFSVGEGIDLGATVRYLREQVDTYEGSGMGVDLGILYHLSLDPKDLRKIGYKNFVLGFAASNVLQPQFKLVQTADLPARVLKPAVSYHLQTSDTSSLWLSFQGEIPEKGDILLKGGLEYSFDGLVFARAGFDGYNPTAGAGLRVSGLELDYAFNQRDLGPLHRFSLTYRFGRFRDPLQAQKIDLLKWVARSYGKSGDYGPAIQSWKNVLVEYPGDEEASSSIQNLQQKRKQAVEDQMRQVRAAMSRGDVDRALPLIAKVLSLDPGNPEAREIMKRVDQKLIVSTNYVRGVEAYSKEDFESAVEYLKSVYEIDPQYRDVKYLYRDAQSHYLPLQSMGKDQTDLYARGVSFYMAGQYPQAIEVWTQALAKDPKNFLIQRNLEEARGRLKDKPVPQPIDAKGAKEKP